MSDMALAGTVRLVAEDHGAVLLNIRNGQMYGLNPVAAFFCTALSEGSDREQATRAVVKTFDADEAVIRADLNTLIADLQGHHLLRTTR